MSVARVLCESCLELLPETEGRFYVADRHHGWCCYDCIEVMDEIYAGVRNAEGENNGTSESQSES
jgi:hypothetical protein